MKEKKELPRRTQNGFLRTSQIPYLLLALALLLALFLWNTLRSKNIQLAELEQLRTSEISTLESRIQSDSESMQDLRSTHQALQNEHNILKTESMPALKRDLSFATAEVQRASHVSTARDSLQISLASVVDSNDELKQQLQTLPALKRELSFAKAEAQRAQHVSDARDNLQSTLASLKSTDDQLEQQLQMVPELKRELSFANAEVQRAKHVSTARDNLAIALTSAKDSNSQLKEQIQMLPELKRELSFAKAEAQRAQHVSDARDNLQSTLASLKNTDDQLEQQLHKDLTATDAVATELNTDELTAANTAASEFEDLQLQNKYLIERLVDRLLTIGRLKKKLSFANAENQRGLHIASTNDKLIEQLHEARQDQENLTHVATQLPRLKKQLSMARAENARLQHVSKARDRLIAQHKNTQLVQSD